MNHPSARLAALLMTAGLFSAGAVRADYTNWSYTWQVTDTTAAHAQLPNNLITSGHSSATFSVPTGNIGPSTTPTPFIGITTNSGTTTGSDSFSTPYDVKMVFTDGNGQSNSANPIYIQGTLSGALNSGTSTLFNTMSNPTASTTFDGHTYTVTLSLMPATGKVPDPGGSAAEIIPTVVVTDATGNNVGGTPAPTAPEPSALLLASMACSACGLGGWWRRRRLPA